MSTAQDTDARKGGNERFGRYRLRGVLGQGGMGRLYVAEQNPAPGAPKIVALKRILPHLADNPQFREMFLNEARVASRLKHRNIVETYEFGEVEGTCFLSMEYLSGEDLAAVLVQLAASAGNDASKAIPVDIALTLIQQCADGLHYAHEARDESGRPLGLVHRDVNPWNIFVTYYGNAKLLDFGIVKDPTGGTRTAPGVFKGKYAYSAPEMFSGAGVTRQSDVFCLGIVLWECLTGRRLFAGATEVATIDAVRSRPIPPPSALRAEIPPALDAVVKTALERDLGARYPSARHLGEALGEVARSRTNAGNVAAWLQSLFGAERAALRNAISHGVDIESSIARLAALGVATASVRTGESARPAPLAAPRSLWSGTNAGMSAVEAGKARPDPLATPAQGVPATLIPSTATVPPPRAASVVSLAPDPVPTGARPRRRPLEAAVVVSAVALLGFGATYFALRGKAAPTAALSDKLATGELQVRSEPPGAHVLVDGNPSGLTTPAVLTGLRVGRAIEIRLERDGFAPVTRTIDVRAGRVDAPVVALVESAGRVRFTGLPAQAQVYVDDNQVDAREPVSLALGPHRVRVEANNDILFDQAVEVARGEQTVTVGGK